MQSKLGKGVFWGAQNSLPPETAVGGNCCTTCGRFLKKHHVLMYITVCVLIISKTTGRKGRLFIWSATYQTTIDAQNLII